MSVLFITGGSRGIGAGLVRHAAAHGHDVAFTWHTRGAAAARLRDEIRVAHPAVRCEAYQLDVRSSDAVDAVAETVSDEFGGVQAVVANAAVTCAGMTFSLGNEQWQNVIDTNLTSAFYLTRAFLPVFLSGGFGRFIYISSIAAHGMAGDVAYCASKAGLLGLSAAVAKEYGRKNITSNALLLSLFETDMTAAELSQQKRDFYAAHCPVGRIGRPDDVGAAVLYLAGEGGSFVNGQALGVTGGLDWFH
ncbi:MAG: SDR family oxidoreductase [Gemmatimonadaceae bacterium]|nr:SDR family oxidoreductase [Gemmatimonadaceae bacterium]